MITFENVGNSTVEKIIRYGKWWVSRLFLASFAPFVVAAFLFWLVWVLGVDQLFFRRLVVTLATESAEAWTTKPDAIVNLYWLIAVSLFVVCLIRTHTARLVVGCIAQYSARLDQQLTTLIKHRVNHPIVVWCTTHWGFSGTLAVLLTSTFVFIVSATHDYQHVAEHTPVPLPPLQYTPQPAAAAIVLPDDSIVAGDANIVQTAAGYSVHFLTLDEQ